MKRNLEQLEAELIGRMNFYWKQYRKEPWTSQRIKRSRSMLRVLISNLRYINNES